MGPKAEIQNSPMGCLPEAALTPSGLLQLAVEDGEVEVLTRDSVELRVSNPMIAEGDKNKEPGNPSRVDPSKWKDRNSDLICTLTTHRIAFFLNKGQVATFLDLCMVSAATASGGYIATAKITLSTFTYGEVIICLESRQDRDKFLNSLSTCLSRRAWLDSARQQQKAILAKERSSNKVGVDAILSKSRERHEDARRISRDAFNKDVDGLMMEARELVGVVNKYVATLEKRKQSTSTQEKASADEEEKKLTELMSQMGMMSALSKKAAGSLYYQQLSRQLADFLRLKKDLLKDTGIITLTDAYCLFNRARGANLISADDMDTAATLLKRLGLGFSKQTFPSGVVVIQSDQYDEKTVSRRLRELCLSKSDHDLEGITALGVSQDWNVSALLALEQLQNAERLGYLCRDTTLEGVRFFDNKFRSWPTT